MVSIQSHQSRFASHDQNINMSTPSSSNSQSHSSDRGQASRGRGGLGKYLRARGRRGHNRPAEFHKRLLLEGEGTPAEDDEEATEAAAENARKYSRRQLTTNADRYEEPEPELGPDGTLCPPLLPIVIYLFFVSPPSLCFDDGCG